MTQQIYKRDGQRPKAPNYPRYGSILNLVIFHAIIWGIAATLSGCDPSTSVVLSYSSPSLQLNMEAGKYSAQLTKLGWDTEGTGRDTINLLESPVELQLSKGNQVLIPNVTSKMIGSQKIQYRFSLQNNKQLVWEISIGDGELDMQILSDDNIAAELDKIELVFPFNPRKALTSIISSNWTNDSRFQLPVIMSAPDIGQMLLTSVEDQDITGYTEGNRSEAWVRVKIELPVPTKESASNLKFTPVVLPIPDGYKDDKRWEAARRGWFNLIQQSCGASGGGKEVVGVWANNVLSDPVSSLLYMLSDATLLVPELAPGVTMPPILRRSIEYFIDHETTDYGLVGYTAAGTPALETDRGDLDPNDKEYRAGDHQMVMDGNPSVIIGAWSYVKASFDTIWLRNRIKDLESVAGYMEDRDIDGDGLIESRQSGNDGSRPPSNPDMAWDAFPSGHKNAYINALAYRAFNNLADLQKQLGEHKQEQRYRQRAEKLKAVFLKTFYNPETGWLAWWISKDGKLHDIYSDIPTSLAIANGIISEERGKEMLQRYWKALEATGFDRFDLGVPICLRPIPRQEMEKSTEFQQFLNGGCCVSNTSYTLDALYTAGMTQQADMILDAMLERQKEGTYPNGGGFQNGFVDRMGFGAEFFDWQGNPVGYEGHLVYSWSFLHSMLRKNPELRF
ncbi:amylo-alpha-1,6-glucosidase [Arenibacter palladensis]|uniref:alpha-L-rhamnosidase-related protein n=1 Tax=Arenibacter palladensis TaxID=237373 RepID=UPI002FD3DCE5